MICHDLSNNLNQRLRITFRRIVDRCGRTNQKPAPIHVIIGLVTWEVQFQFIMLYMMKFKAESIFTIQVMMTIIVIIMTYAKFWIV